MTLGFRYFRGPEADMSFLPGVRICSLCGQPGRCFELDTVIGTGLTEAERSDRYGCLDCLRADRFGFAHDTEIGFFAEDGFQLLHEPDSAPTRVFMVASDGEATTGRVPLLYPPKPSVSEEAIAELRRTPSFSTWQEVSWPVHHDDFMTYLGTWGPDDFAEAAPEGAGRTLFVEMVDSYFHTLWPEDKKPGFEDNILAFQCLHCPVRVGIPDFD